MSAGCTHIVGAGVAGLSAALAASAAGEHAALYEAAPQAGGRCRTLPQADGFTHDNGTHVLFTANRRALAFLEIVGARSDWIEPEPAGLPIYDAATQCLSMTGLSPLSWFDEERRPQGLGIADVARLLRLAFPFGDRPVGAISGDRPITRNLVEPLTVAILNTPVESASSRKLGRALRRLARPGAARLLVARRGLSADLIDPALRVLAGRGVALQAGHRLRGLDLDSGRIARLIFADRTVAVPPEDRVILALPPWEIARLLPDLPVPSAFEPILNLHYPIAGPARPRFVGLLGTLAQWALVRPDHVSVTASAAGGAVDTDADALAEQVWREIAPALRALGLALDRDPVPSARVVKEKRATIRQAAGAVSQPPVRPLANLALAGDWIGTLPATIESAVVSGERAVRALRSAGPGFRHVPEAGSALPIGGAP